MSRALSPEEIAERYAASITPEEEEVWLAQYLSEACIVIRGTTVSRRELVEFVCYRLGGVHDDKGDPNPKFDLLEAALDGVLVADKRAPYFELLAIGQSIARSPDVSRFLTAATAATQS